MSNKYFHSSILIVLISVLFILNAGKIDYESPKYSQVDLAKYITMAEASPSLSFEVPHPYIYRILAPWFAGLFPFSISTNFYILNSLFLIGLSLLLFKFMIFHNVELYVALFVTIMFILNRYFFAFLAFDYFQFSDTLSYFLLLYSFLLLTKKKWILYSIIVTAGCLTREVALLIIPVGVIYLIEKRGNYRDQINHFISIILPICVFLLIRLLIPSSGKDNYLTQFVDGIEYFSIFAIIKKLFIAVTPFALIAVLFPKKLLNFFMEKKYLLILFLGTFASTFWGFDHERLMTPAAPVFFLFLAIILEQITVSFQAKRKIINFYLTLFILGYLSTFYHLWGIVKLPTREVTLIVTLVLNVLVGIFFLFYHKSIKNITVKN